MIMSAHNHFILFYSRNNFSVWMKNLGNIKYLYKEYRNKNIFGVKHRNICVYIYIWVVRGSVVG